MIYAISDLHGRYDRYKKVIAKIKDDDELYILGDCIDRGEEGIDIIQDIRGRSNVHLLLGNHELLLLDALSSLVNQNMTLDELMYTESYDLWMYNGGYPTLKSLLDKDLLQDVFNYIYTEVELYKIVEVNNEKIYLGHGSVLRNYEEVGSMSLKDYLDAKLSYNILFTSLWESPFKYPMKMDYGLDKYVFGHKYVQQFGSNKMIVRDNMIDIDGGCAMGASRDNSLILLCLDTMKEEYIK